MKLNFTHKITFIYTALMLCVLALVAVVASYWLSDYTDRLYYDFLEDRAYAIGQQNLDRFNGSEAYEAYCRHRKFVAVHPVSQQIVLDADNDQPQQRQENQKVLNRLLTSSQQRDLLRHKLVHFRHHDNLGVAIYYPKQEGDFIVIVTLNEHLGDFLQNRFAYWLIAIVALFIIIVFLVGKIYTQRYINRLDEALLREKQFVHHASHELNNPLTAIRGECEIMLLKSRNGEEYVGALGRIEEESKRMSQIIKQLLYLSSAMEEDKGNDQEPICWCEFLKQFAADDRVVLNIETDENAVIEANPYLLKIAMGNVVRNALKYSCSQVFITLSAGEISVADHGIGIPQKELALIWQPFYRASNTHDYKGGGIGISLASRIFKLYGIKMEVQSKENMGTTVFLKF